MLTLTYNLKASLVQFKICEMQHCRRTDSTPITLSTVSQSLHTLAYLLVDFKVLCNISPLRSQNVTSWTGQRITDQEISVTLHQVFCNLQQYRVLHMDTQTNTRTPCLFTVQTFNQIHWWMVGCCTVAAFCMRRVLSGFQLLSQVWSLENHFQCFRFWFTLFNPIRTAWQKRFSAAFPDFSCMLFCDTTQFGWKLHKKAGK